VEPQLVPGQLGDADDGEAARARRRPLDMFEP
jgi:hypothetical protein